MRLNYIFVMETGAVYAVSIDGEDAPHCDGLARGLLAEHDPSQVYDVAAYPVAWHAPCDGECVRLFADRNIRTADGLRA